MKNKVIHCIGDSHACFFTGRNRITQNSKIPFFKVYWIGPVLAYNLNKLNTTSKGREKLFDILDKLPKGDSVMLCFGEIDCRCHLLKQASLQKKSVAKIVEDCVFQYIKTIEEVNNKGFDVLVWGPVPTANDDIPINPKYPTFGIDAQRNKVTELFNNILTKELPKIGVKHISIFKNLIDVEYKSIQEYQMDGIHLSQKAMPMAIDALRGNDYPID